MQVEAVPMTWVHEKTIRRYMSNIQRRSRLSSKTIESYTESSAGVAIMQMFVADLLGRNSSQSMTYLNKADVAFMPTRTVTKNMKFWTLVLIGFLNAFFFFGCLGYGITQGDEWQDVWYGLSVLS